MEKYILRPLSIADQEGIDVFAGKLRNNRRLYMLSGNHSVGKTAFCFKLFHFLEIVKDGDGPVLYVHFDEALDYWKNLSIRDYPNALSQIFFKRFSSDQFSEFRMFLDHQLTPKNYQFVIIDGIYHCPEMVNRKFYNKFIIELMDLSCSVKISFLLLERRRKPTLLSGNILHSHRPLLPETWFLDRPAYRIEDIKEFGDTNVFVY